MTSEPRQLEQYVWEIPQGYVAGMRAPARVFASESLFRKAEQDKAVEQIANVATLPGIVGAALAMPDIHWGYGFPIGGVAATDVRGDGVISPGGVGFDIGCGVRLIRSDLSWKEASPRSRSWSPRSQDGFREASEGKDGCPSAEARWTEC
jgi:tRNA-splicing ligase RtcB